MQTHTEWKSTTKYIVGTGLFIFVLALIFLSRSILGILVVSSLIALLVRPIIIWLSEKFRFPRILAVLVTYILVAIVIILAPLVLIPQIINAVDFLLKLDYEELISSTILLSENTLSSWKDSGLQIMGFKIVLDSVVDPILTTLDGADTAVTPELPSLSVVISSIAQAFAVSYGFAVDVAGTVFSGIVGFLFLIISSIYLSVDGDKFVDGFVKAVPKPYQSEVRTLFERLRVIWGGFFRGQIILMLIIGSMVWLGLTILGVPGAFALGIIAGLFEIVPNLGPLLSAIPGVLVALLQGSNHFAINNLVFALIVIGLYIVVNFFENTFVVPRVMGESVKLHPLVIIIGVLVGASIWGVLGALLAAPVIASGREIFGYLYNRTIGEEPFKKRKEAQPAVEISLRESFVTIKEKAENLVRNESPPSEEGPELQVKKPEDQKDTQLPQ